MSYAPGAPAPVWCLDIPPGTKLTLMALWSWADHDDQRECRACTVWTKAREGLTPGQALRGALAIQTCQTERAVRQHLTKLRSLGLADASGRCVTLTPAWQSCPLSVGPANTASGTTVSTRDTTASTRANTASVGDTTASLQLNPPVPPSPLTPGEGGTPAPATPQPSVNGAPVGETPDRAAAAANPNLGSQLEVHRARLASHPPAPSRAELTPAVHAAVVDARMSSQLEGATWVKCMLEALDDFGIGEGEHAATVARVLAAWTSGERARPPKSQLWYRKHRDWQREAMGLGEVKRRGNMSGGLVPVTTSTPNRYVSRAEARELRDAELAAQQGAP